jgi:hypothetical protein
MRFIIETILKAIILADRSISELKKELALGRIYRFEVKSEKRRTEKAALGRVSVHLSEFLSFPLLPFAPRNLSLSLSLSLSLTLSQYACQSFCLRPLAPHTTPVHKIL